eukprot:GHVU01009398.1.p1 GENE.GHVU01009398.1~~GHVU01009398.1.p1  ORF type:complete len:179 (+),score=6.35 GHVU01009398.1:65-601(+)
MNTFTFLLTVLVGASVLNAKHLNRRQDLSALPTCGQKCLLKAASNDSLLGECSLDDEACLCKDEPFQLSVRQCVVKTCKPASQLKVIAFDDKTCPGQNLAGLPACGQLCLLKSAADKRLLGTCAGTDNACLCKNSAFQGTVRACITSTCQLQDTLAMESWSLKTCSLTDNLPVVGGLL